MWPQEENSKKTIGKSDNYRTLDGFVGLYGVAPPFTTSSLVAVYDKVYFVPGPALTKNP